MSFPTTGVAVGEKRPGRLTGETGFKNLALVDAKSHFRNENTIFLTGTIRSRRVIVQAAESGQYDSKQFLTKSKGETVPSRKLRQRLPRWLGFLVPPGAGQATQNQIFCLLFRGKHDKVIGLELKDARCSLGCQLPAGQMPPRTVCSQTQAERMMLRP